MLRNKTPTKIKRHTAKILKQIKLNHKLQHKPSKLSKNKQQQITITQTLITKPTYIITNKPTNNLNIHTTKKIQKLIHNLNHNLNISFLIITHNLKLTQQINKIIKIKNKHLNKTNKKNLINKL